MNIENGKDLFIIYIYLNSLIFLLVKYIVKDFIPKFVFFNTLKSEVTENDTVNYVVHRIKSSGAL